MSVRVVQKETTYEVNFNDVDYQVTVMEDNISVGYTVYDVFDENGELVEGDLEEAIINYLEENS
jgi:hypothetical protein